MIVKSDAERERGGASFSDSPNRQTVVLLHYEIRLNKIATARPATKCKYDW